jgi:hypothetical protein
MMRDLKMEAGYALSFPVRIERRQKKIDMVLSINFIMRSDIDE